MQKVEKCSTSNQARMELMTIARQPGWEKWQAPINTHDVNPWLPHKARFGWDYITNHATLWLDICKQLIKEHFQEWEAQKKCPYQLGPLEHDTELAYHRHLARREAESDAADSCKEEAKKLLPECQAAREFVETASYAHQGRHVSHSHGKFTVPKLAS